MSSKKVLIVDDDTSILEAMDLTLRSFGYVTRPLSEASGVYKNIKHFKPDLIILDVLLSGADGKEICKTLKSTKSTSKLPVILISAHTDLVKTAKKFGADDYLEKPFELEALIKKVSKYA